MFIEENEGDLATRECQLTDNKDGKYETLIQSTVHLFIMERQKIILYVYSVYHSQLASMKTLKCMCRCIDFENKYFIYN